MFSCIGPGRVAAPALHTLQGEFARMLIRKIEVFLKHTKMPPTRFGRLAASDPRFVLDLRKGREPRSVTEGRVRAFMAGWEAHAEDAARIAALAEEREAAHA